MIERPILFSGPMVRAILEGRKTQTRRVIKFQEDGCLTGDCPHDLQEECGDHFRDICPYGRPGDRLWVRETFCPNWNDNVIYKADGGSAIDAGYSKEPRWKPSIHIPRLASRINLEITNIRVEHVRMIGVGDVQAEGISGSDPDGPYAEFAKLWDSINAKRGFGWAQNPWVWVIEFRKLE